MEKFVKGDVVIVPFPFSDLSNIKRRPALVIATPTGEDLILAQITSKQHNDQYAIPLNNQDFKTGGLPVPSNIRPTKIMTIEKNIIQAKAGSLETKKISIIEENLIRLFTT